MDFNSTLFLFPLRLTCSPRSIVTIKENYYKLLQKHDVCLYCYEDDYDDDYFAAGCGGKSAWKSV